MAKVVLSADESRNVTGSNDEFFGSSGSEKLVIFDQGLAPLAPATNLSVDQSIERFELSGSSSDYKFQAAGNQLSIFKADGTLVTKIPVASTDTQDIVFSDGKADLKFEISGANAGKITVGGAVASDATGGATLTSPTLAAADASSHGSGSSTTPTYALAAAQTEVNEGGTATFNLTTTNVAANTEVAYTISGTGIEGTDVTGGSLTGKATVGADGKATITVSLAEDATTENDETFTVSIDGQTGISATTTIKDTSTAATTFTLTTATDDNIVGTTADNTITGAVTGLSSTNTLQTTDKVDGGAGNDTLTLDISSDFSGFGTGSITNVETLSFTNKATLSRSFDNTGTTGVTTYKLDANDLGFTFADLEAAGKTFDISNADEASTINMNYVASAVSGSSDAATVKLTDVGTAKTSTAAAKEVTLSSAGVESVTVDLAGTTNDAILSGFTDAKSLTITGSGGLTSSAIGANVTEIDASAATGNLDITGATTSSFDTLKMGSGNDKATLTNLAVTASLEGGAGTDEIVFNGSAATTVQPTVSGFETASFKGLAGDLVISGTNVTDVTKVQVIDALGATAASGSNLTLANLPNTTLTIALTDTESGTGSETATTNTAIYTGSGALTVETSTAKSTATAKATDITAAAVTSATINVGDKAELTGHVQLAAATNVSIDSKVALTALAVTAGKATSVNLKGLGDVTSSGTEFNLDDLQSLTLDVTGNVILNSGTKTIGKDAKSVTVDASKVTGGVTLDVGGYAAGGGQAQIVGTGLGVNTIKIGTGRNEVQVKGGISNDAVTLFDSTTVVPVSGEGSYNIDLGSVSLADTLTLGGTGTVDSFNFSNATVTLTGVDHIVAEANETLTMKAAALSGQTLTIGTTAAATPAAAIGAITLNGTAAGETIDLGNVVVAATGQTITTTGAAGNDTITGTAVADSIDGGDGNDSITGGAGNDTITGGAGNNTIIGGAGDDAITALESDSIDGGDGTADAVTFGAAVTAANLVDADLANVESITLSTAVSADFSAQTEALTITGSSGADTITGGDGADTITGGEGADSIIAADTDSIDGGNGTDTVTFGAAVTATNLANGDLANVENIILSSAVSADFTNQAEALAITGSSGNDTITGGAGADSITGGAGADSIILAAGGDDVLNYLIANINASNADTVVNFAVSGGDTIDFTDLTNADLRGTGADLDTDGGTAGAGLVATTGLLTSSAQQANLDLSTAEVYLRTYEGATAASDLVANDKLFFAIDNGTDSALFYYEDSDGGADVDSGEVKLVLTFSGIAGAETLVAADFADFT